MTETTEHHAFWLKTKENVESQGTLKTETQNYTDGFACALDEYENGNDI